LFCLPTVSTTASQLYVCLKKVHLFSFNKNSFSKLLSVSLFRRGMTISSAVLSKHSTATDDGRTVLYSKNTSLTDGYRCNISSDLSLLAHGLAPRQCPRIGSITARKLSIAIIMFDFTLCSTKSALSYVCFLCLRHRRMQNKPYHVCLVALTLYMLMKFKKIEIAAILRWTSWT